MAETAAMTHCEQCMTRGRCVFFGLPAQQAQMLKPHIRERVVSAGECLERQGHQGDTVMVVKVGLVKGMRGASANDAKAIAVLGKGRLLGFNNLFGNSSHLTMAAITPARACEVDVCAVRELAMPHQDFQQAVYRAVGSTFDCIADWSRILREDRYLHKLCQALEMIAREEGSNAFRIPSHVELANLLGSRRETIARHISGLIDKGRFRKVDRWHGVLTGTCCESDSPSLSVPGPATP